MKSVSANLKFLVSLLGVAWTTVNAATGNHLPAWSPPAATAIAAALVWLVPNLVTPKAAVAVASPSGTVPGASIISGPTGTTTGSAS